MKYRILAVGPTAPPYHGVSMMTENLLQSSLSSEFDLHFVDIADRRGIANIGALDLGNVKLALCHAAKFFGLLRRCNPDLVYLPISQGLWGFLRDLLFLLPAGFLRKKVLIHLHGGEFDRFYSSMPGPLCLLTRSVFRRNTWAIVLSDCLKYSFKGLIEHKRIYVVPNGIDGVQCPKQKVTSKNERIHILYLSNLRESKGFLELLAVVPKVLKHCPNVRFSFVGEKTYPDEMEKANLLVAEHHLEQCVKMPGVIRGREKNNLLADADIFVFPPIAQEGQPLVLLEAMSAGLPIVSTDRGSIRETIDDGVTGFVVRPRDPDALLKALLKLIKNKNLRRNMGLKGKERFHKHFTKQRWVSNMKTVFYQTLEPVN